MVPFFLSTFFLLSAFAKAEEVPAPKDVLTFEDVLRKVSVYYPVLKKENARVEASLALKWQSVSALFPSVRGTTSYQAGDDPVYVFGSLLRQNAFQQGNFSIPALNNPRHRSNFEFALEGEAPIFEAFQTFAKIRSTSFRVRAAQDQNHFAAMEASLLALEGFLSDILSEQIFRAADDVKRAIEKDIRQAEDLKEKGLVLGADFYAARVLGSGITQKRNSLESESKRAVIFLNILMGEEPTKLTRVRGRLPDQFRVKKPLENWLADAYENRADLRAIEWMIRAQESEKFREKTSVLPRLRVFGQVRESSHDLRTGGEDYVAGVKGTVDIVDPSYVPRIKHSNALLKELNEDRNQLRDQVKRAVSEKALQYEAVLANGPLAVQAREDAKEAVTQTERLYQEGRKSIADLLEMREAFLASDFAMREAFYESEFRHAELLFLSGRLNEDSLKEIGARLSPS